MIYCIEVPNYSPKALVIQGHLDGKSVSTIAKWSVFQQALSKQLKNEKEELIY